MSERTTWVLNALADNDFIVVNRETNVKLRLFNRPDAEWVLNHLNEAAGLAERVKTLRAACERVDAILRDCVRLELSAAAWSSAGDPYLHDAGPVWSGLPGEQPLLPIIRAALAAQPKEGGK